MTEPSKAKAPVTQPKDRIIVALDVETAEEAQLIVSELGDAAGAYKIGLQLFVSAGPEFVRSMTNAGTRIFLDLKFHDIPNTVAKASVEAAKLGVWMFNVHTAGGREMMSAAADAVKDFCCRTGGDVPVMLGVTVLTSASAETLRESGIERDVNDQVIALTQQAVESGLNGVVASPWESLLIRREMMSADLMIVTPGIRPAGATNDDQKRVMTPAEAISAGSDYLVIGRPITAAPDRKAALEKVIEEIARAK